MNLRCAFSNEILATEWFLGRLLTEPNLITNRGVVPGKSGYRTLGEVNPSGRFKAVTDSDVGSIAHGRFRNKALQLN
jgi:hypothetical protein